MTEYRIEVTDNRGQIKIKPWVQCDEATAKRAYIEACRHARFFGFTKVEIRKRVTEESSVWKVDFPWHMLEEYKSHQEVDEGSTDCGLESSPCGTRKDK